MKTSACSSHAMQQVQKGRPSPVCCTCMFSRYLMGSFIQIPFCRQQGGLHLPGLTDHECRHCTMTAAPLIYLYYANFYALRSCVSAACIARLRLASVVDALHVVCCLCLGQKASH